MSEAAERYALEGWLSVRAALISGSRDIHEVLILNGKDNARLSGIKKRAREQDIPFRFVSEEVLLKHTEGQTHGGVVALVGPRKFLPLTEIGRGPKAAFLAMLDGVEDPFNFGQAVRALHAAGAHGLVLRPRNWTTAAATVGRASAGASEFMPMALAGTDEELLETIRTHNLKLICTDMSQKTVPLFKANLQQPLIVVIGGERRGVSKSLLRAADTQVQIPYGRNFKQSLGTSAATAIIAFEVMRQRQSYR